MKGCIFMAINKMQIKNFTVFSEFDIEFNSGVNLLVGGNGVGKTQLLKLIYASAISQKRHIAENGKEGKINMGVPSDIIRSSMSSVFDVDFEYLEENFITAKFSTKYDGLFCPPTVFIPAKEMLSHAKGLLPMKKKHGENMPFDASLLDIIEKAQTWKLSEVPKIAQNIVSSLEKTIDGIVETKEDGSFWVKKSNGCTIPFSMEAEGLKRFGLLWQLLMNEEITTDTVVLWDEPEASINPEKISVLVEAILELQRNGVQIIVATHSYNFARYFDVLRKKSDNVQFFSLYKVDTGFVQYSQSDSFIKLSPNLIDEAGERLYNDVIQKAMEEI
jgi:predicted ATPase